jgi:hypothetical protein
LPNNTTYIDVSQETSNSVAIDDNIPLPASKPLSGGGSGMSWADFQKQLEEEEAANPKPESNSEVKAPSTKKPSVKKAAPAEKSLDPEEEEKRRLMKEKELKRRQEMKEMMAKRKQETIKDTDTTGEPQKSGMIIISFRALMNEFIYHSGRTKRNQAREPFS